MVQYKHTQFATVIVISLAAAIVFQIALLCVLMRSEDAQSFALAIIGSVAALLAVCIFLFYKLTVEVTADCLAFRFGTGLIGKKIPTTEISKCRPVRNRFWHGWGIHRYGGGWLYNVAGFQAVEVTLKSGKQLRIGTGEPEALCQAIEAVTDNA